MSVRSIGRKIAKSQTGLLAPIERLLLRKVTSRFDIPLVAIVGPPRIGSTLAYQILAQCLDVSYLSNLQYALLRSPYIAGWLTRTFCPAYKADFRSAFGYVKGLSAPSEATEFWRYWFDHEMIERPPRPDPQRLQAIGRMLSKIHDKTQQPLLSCWNAHAFYINDLKAIFPHTFFIRIRRDSASVVASILRAREALFGDIDHWWSMTPVESLQAPDADCYTEAAIQVLATEQRLDHHATSETTRMLQVGYEEICQDPHAFVDQIQNYLKEGGVTVHKKENLTLPESFSISRPKDDAERLGAIKNGLQQAEALLASLSENT